MIISKTTFLSFLECQKDVWFRFHRPDEVGKLELSDFELHILEQGNEVETEARKCYPRGIQVTSAGDEAVKDTLQLMKAKTDTIFQATFLIDGFIVKADVLRYSKADDNWDLYEVKGTNSLKEGGGESRDHITDLTFQLSVLKRAKVNVGRCFIIHLNKEYVRKGDIDLKSLFHDEDVTSKVHARLSEIEEKMNQAHSYLASEREPMPGCGCVYKARKKHCTSFQLSNPHIPDYSVHDLSRVSKKKLDALIQDEIFDLADIPEDFELTDNQKNQVIAHKQKKPIIDITSIKKELNSLAYPLYFFDYEAFGPAIPVFDGYGPYKHIPFQFSLHILKERKAKPEHIEFLQEDLSDPSEKVVQLLKENIPAGGTIIAWHKTFERMVCKEIGTRLPEHAKFFEAFNERIYDLKDIFQDQYYVHPGFKGRASIKKILPILASELRYDALEIKEGGQAADAWWRMVSSETTPSEKAQIAKALKIYCGLDTYAMYAIWKHLDNMVN